MLYDTILRVTPEQHGIAVNYHSGQSSTFYGIASTGRLQVLVEPRRIPYAQAVYIELCYLLEEILNAADELAASASGPEDEDDLTILREWQGEVISLRDAWYARY